MQCVAAAPEHATEDISGAHFNGAPSKSKKLHSTKAATLISSHVGVLLTRRKEETGVSSSHGAFIVGYCHSTRVSFSIHHARNVDFQE